MEELKLVKKKIDQRLNKLKKYIPVIKNFRFTTEPYEGL